MAQQNRNKNSNTFGQVVKYKKGNQRFQVITNKGSVLKYRDELISFEYVLLGKEQIFGKSLQDIPTESDLEKAFGTHDIIKCAKEIIENGELQYTKEERKKFIDDKTKQIAQYIHENFVDPKTKYPHPQQRIINCMKECRIKIDPDKDTIKQSLNAINKMSKILMFKMADMLTIRLIIKHSYYHKITKMIKKYVNVISKDWNNIGCVLIIQCTPTNWDNLQSNIYKQTNGGDYDFKDITNSSVSNKNVDDIKSNDYNKDKGGRGKNRKNKNNNKNNQKQKPSKVENNGNDNNNKIERGKKRKNKKSKQKDKFLNQY